MIQSSPQCVWVGVCAPVDIYFCVRETVHVPACIFFPLISLRGQSKSTGEDCPSASNMERGKERGGESGGSELALFLLPDEIGLEFSFLKTNSRRPQNPPPSLSPPSLDSSGAWRNHTITPGIDHTAAVGECCSLLYTNNLYISICLPYCVRPTLSCMTQGPGFGNTDLDKDGCWVI